VIQIASGTKRHENIVQKVHFVDDLSHKNRLLDHLLRDETLDQAVVFTATKRDADTIADRLNIAGFAAAALHGDMHQGARNRTLDSMRRGQVKVLVATDVAARGIDVPTITHVVNYDLPKFPEDYVHRIGRTGRAGRNGIAVSLVNHAEGMNVKRIERFTKQTIPVDVVEGFEPKRSAPARSGARPGWKPGDGRNAGAKPGQRSFHKPGSGPREGGFRSEGAPREGGYNRDSAPREGGYNRDAARPAAGGYSRDGGPRRDSAPREGGYRGSHPRSADNARRTFGDR
jgi:superfamily II DNA/RNA helicase